LVNIRLQKPKNRWWNCVQTDINTFKIKNWKKGQKTVLTGRSSLRRHRSALGCNATSGGGGGRRTTRLQKKVFKLNFPLNCTFSPLIKVSFYKMAGSSQMCMCI
jgi:hypothetical protein